MPRDRPAALVLYLKLTVFQRQRIIYTNPGPADIRSRFTVEVPLRDDLALAHRYCHVENPSGKTYVTRTACHFVRIVQWWIRGSL